MLNLEFAFLNWIQADLRGPVLDAVMPVVTALCNGGLVWFALGGILLLKPSTRHTGLAVLISLGLEILCCNCILKPLVARPRPCDLDTAVRLLIPRPSGYSFPSGHTGASFAAASALIFRRNRLWPPALALAALIAFSRMYLYVHFPTDILAGVLVGLLSGCMGTLAASFLGGEFHAAE